MPAEADSTASSSWSITKLSLNRSVDLGQLSACSRAQGFGGCPFPSCRRRQLLALGDQRQGPQRHVVTDESVVQNRRASPDGHTGADVDPPDLHHPILEEVRLWAAPGVEFGLISDVHAIEFGEIGGVDIDATADLRAEQPQRP